MTLPMGMPYPPMEATLVDAVPEGEGWQYEPKWDGFRGLAFRDGQKVELQSKGEKTLTRYFPEVVEALQGVKADRFVLDGEIVIPVDGSPSFDDLLMRIHPAASRINKLAKETPAVLIAFDLLVDDAGTDLTGETLAERRKRLERFAKRYFRGDTLRLSPMTRDFDEARQWFQSLRHGLDGVVAKRLDMDYRSGRRDGMQKVKRMRTADCVVAGYRYASKGGAIGSLLLGLYDGAGLLHHVGFTSSFKAGDRAKLKPKIEALRRPTSDGGGFSGRAPGGPSRWSTERSGQWEPLAPELVVEVQYDHFTAGRFRHGTKLLRWRPDKPPRQCTLEQVERESRGSMELLKSG